MGQSTKRFLYITCSLVFTSLLLVAVFREQSLSDFVDLLRAVSAVGVGVYIFLSLSALLMRALRYELAMQCLCEVESAPSRGQWLIVTAVRNALVDFFPFRLGEAGFFVVLGRYGISVFNAGLVFGVCLFLDLIALGFIVLGVLVLSGSSLAMELWILGGLGALGGALFLLWKGRDLWELAKEKIKPLARLKKDDLVSLLLLTVGLRTLKYLSLYVLLLAVVSQWGLGSNDIPMATSILSFVTAEAAASLPVSGVMGFGAYEAAGATVFGISSVKIPSVTSVIFAVHLITQVVGYSIGSLGLLWFGAGEVFRYNK